MGTTELLADALRVLHYAVGLLILLPFVLPPGEWLKYSCILCIIIVTAWHDGSGECQATSVEEMLRGSYVLRTEDTKLDYMKLRASFARPTIDTVLSPMHRTITPHGAHHFLYLLFLIGALVSLLRYLVYKNISLYPSTRLGAAYCAALVAFVTLWATGTAKRHAIGRRTTTH